jgi:hypothetical protein
MTKLALARSYELTESLRYMKSNALSNKKESTTSVFKQHEENRPGASIEDEVRIRELLNL